MCGSLVICGKVSIPSVQGEWVSECGPCVAHWSSVEKWVYRLCRVSECRPCVAHWSSVEKWVYRLSRVSEWVSVDRVWLTGHLWKSEYTVCAGWVSVWVSVDRVWFTGRLWKSEYTVCVGLVSEWVWTMCDSLVICGKVSIPSVLGEWVSECGPCVTHWSSVEKWVDRLCWVSECGPCVAHWSSVEQWVYRLCRVSERCVVTKEGLMYFIL
jgi:hypothetical protein